MFTGYIDESGDSKLFTLAVIVGDSCTWEGIESEWKKVLSLKNDSLIREGRQIISRFKSSDCSSRQNEFEGWTVPEQVEFVTQLLAVFRDSAVLEVLSYSVDLDELVAEVPETKGNPEGFAYVLLLQLLMLEIGNEILASTDEKIILFHDRCKYDAALLETFNLTLSATTFEQRNQFVTIASQSWEDCVPLQPADIVAFESYKEVERHKRKTRPRMRKSLEFLMHLPRFDLTTKLIGVTDLQKFKTDLFDRTSDELKDKILALGRVKN